LRRKLLLPLGILGIFGIGLFIPRPLLKGAALAVNRSGFQRTIRDGYTFNILPHASALYRVSPVK
jgi:hypothetical protein